MTLTLQDLERRLSALEARMDRKTVLPAGQDSDLRSMASALSSQTHVLEALAISEMQHTESLAGLRREMRQAIGMLTTLVERDGRQ